MDDEGYALILMLVKTDLPGRNLSLISSSNFPLSYDKSLFDRDVYVRPNKRSHCGSAYERKKIHGH